MAEPVSWHASMKEQRAFLAIALLCIVIMAVAGLKPDLFSRQPEPANQSIETQVDNEAEQASAVANASDVAAVQKPEAVDTSPSEQLAVISPANKPEAKPAVKPAVAKPQPRPAPVPKAVVKPAAASAIASGYYVQLGAFSESPRAQGMADQVSLKGWKARVVPKGKVHAVWVGPVANRGEADAARKEIEKKLKLKGFIVHSPK